MIFQIVGRILLIPLGQRKKLYSFANIGAIVASTIFSRIQNQRTEEIQRKLEILVSQQKSTPIQITRSSEECNFGAIERLTHFVLKVAPVVTGMTPIQLITYITRSLIQHGYRETIDNLPGHTNAAQQRRRGIAQHPISSFALRSPRNIFPAETREENDIRASRQYSEESELICIYLDERTVTVHGTILVYLRLLLIFLTVREISLIAGKYLNSKNVIILEESLVTKKRAQTKRINPANKTREK